MIIFEKISMKNFFSVGNAPIEIIYKEGLHYVTGRDSQTGLRNGVGKSVLMVDSILFALYGKTLRRSTPKIINNKNNGNCVVTLDFRVNDKYYKIERGLAPSFLRFTKDDGTEVELSKKRDTQQIINDIIKIDLNTCKNMLVMSINSTKPFMSMYKCEKRQFIERILNIDILGIMYRLINDNFNKLRTKKKDLEGRFELLSKHYQKLKEQNEKLKQEINEFEDKRQKEIDVLITRKQELEKSIEKRERVRIGVIKTKLDKLREQQIMFHKIMEKLRIKMSDKNSKILEIEQFIKDFKEMEICPICNATLTKTHKQKELDNKIKEIDIISCERDNIKSKWSNYTESEPKIKEQIEKLREKYNTAITTNDHLENVKEKIQLVEQQILNEKERTINITLHDLEEIHKDYLSLKDELITINEDFKYISFQKSMFSDEGIKTYIIRQILPILNSKIKYYLERMGINIWIEFDEELKEKIIQRGQNTLPYDNFSAGEQKRVDLALLLAFIDIARSQGQNATNLLVLDELMDSSLDTEGLELFMDIIKEKCIEEKMGIYIISHRKDYNSDLYNSIYVLEKSEGFTKIRDIFGSA